jgi:hypothetical protein
MPESIETLYEQIDDLTDDLDNANERADENERLVTELFHAYHDSDPIQANRLWHDEQTLQELLPSHCFKFEPGQCLGEIACIDGKKVECAFYGKWTNCRERGHCTRDDI